jgi:predicted TIM-barrel fold metal-dependent hydrolase
MRTRNGRRKVPFGTNYPMIFHEPALADLDALALDDETRELCLSANAQRLFKGEPRRLLCRGERERPGWRV